MANVRLLHEGHMWKFREQDNFVSHNEFVVLLWKDLALVW